jgi:hypothetical protein
MMTLKEIVQLKFNIELPIRGGIGTEEAPYILTPDVGVHYIQAEYLVVKYHFLIRLTMYTMNKQLLMNINNRFIDRFEVTLSDGKLSAVYIDYTDCK